MEEIDTEPFDMAAVQILVSHHHYFAITETTTYIFDGFICPAVLEP